MCLAGVLGDVGEPRCVRISVFVWIVESVLLFEVLDNNNLLLL